VNTNYRIIQTPWLNYLCEFIKNTKNELLVVAPFFSLEIIEKIVKYADKGVELRFLLGANARGIAAGVCDYEALIFLHEISSQRDITVKNIPNLHGKVVISDGTKAILSSSNLTREGLQRNIEFGMELDGDAAQELYRLIRGYWNEAEVVTLNAGINNAREGLASFQEKERDQEIPETPLGLGIRIDPKGSDLSSAPPIAVIGQEISSPVQGMVVDPNERSNLLFNVWWNDNDFKGACLDVSNKPVCRSFFLKRDGEDRTKECETYQSGCDSAYIFSNHAYYINTDLDDRSLNKCAFFIARNPDDDKYWIIGYLFINEKGANFSYVNEAGETVSFQRYIKGDESLSLRFQPYMVFDERFIRQLSIGSKWGRRSTSEVNWITHHTRSSASCTYISNADSAAILETYKNHTKNLRHKELVSRILEKHYYKHR
jgi:hypothetical protein